MKIKLKGQLEAHAKFNPEGDSFVSPKYLSPTFKKAYQRLERHLDGSKQNF